MRPSAQLKLAAALAPLACAFAFAGPAAAAEPTGAFAVFKECPLSNPEVTECIYAKTTGGELKAGSVAVPIKVPVILQGGTKEEESAYHKLVGAANGETLSKSPEAVPGGLFGITAPEYLEGEAKEEFEEAINNGITGVHATTELVGEPSTVVLNPTNLIFEEGVALELPVRLHLENAFLGSHCYIGSASNPITLKLTTGTTSPPEPNKPISGSAGALEVLEAGNVVKLSGGSLVENAFAVPGAEGCGGIFAPVVDQAVDARLGLPSPAGHNTAILKGELEQGYAPAVRESEG
jgi:hypothetical protein